MTGAAVQWLRDGLGLIDGGGRDRPAGGDRCPTPAASFVVPAFTGLGSPWWDPYARGHRGRHHPRDDPRPPRPGRGGGDGLPDPRRGRGDGHGPPAVTCSELRVDGGAAAMDLLLQLQADQLGVTVRRPVDQETTALGAAYLAGLAEGVWGSLDDVAAAVAAGRRVHARPSTATPPTPSTRPGCRAVERSRALGRRPEPLADLPVAIRRGAGRASPTPEAARRPAASTRTERAGASCRRSRARNGRPVRPTTSVAVRARASAHATSSAPPVGLGRLEVAAAVDEGDDPAAPTERAAGRERHRRRAGRSTTATQSLEARGSVGAQQVEARPVVVDLDQDRLRPRAGRELRVVVGSPTTAWHPLDVDALDLGRSRRRAGRPARPSGSAHHELVDGPPAALLEDLDADDVAVHRADPAGHLAERARPIGQPDAHDEAVHGATVPSVPVAAT